MSDEPIKEGPALVEMTAQAETYLSGLMFKADYFSIPDSDDRLSIEDADWNDHYMEVATDTKLTYTFEARFDEGTEGLTDIRIVNVEVPGANS